LRRHPNGGVSIRNDKQRARDLSQPAACGSAAGAVAPPRVHPQRISRLEHRSFSRPWWCCRWCVRAPGESWISESRLCHGRRPPRSTARPPTHRAHPPGRPPRSGWRWAALSGTHRHTSVRPPSRRPGPDGPPRV